MHLQSSLNVADNEIERAVRGWEECRIRSVLKIRYSIPKEIVLVEHRTHHARAKKVARG